MKTILTAVVGSTVHGTSVSDGLEDLDLMSVAVEDFAHFVDFKYDRTVDPAVLNGGISEDTWVHRTKPEHTRSEAGDVDHVIYGLKKYVWLLFKNNPSAMLPLFAPESSLQVCTAEGHVLRSAAPMVVSKQCYEPFRGYIVQQFERMKGTRGQMNVTRPELVEKYGYDTKYAGHIMRLGFQGIELLSKGRITLPMPEDQRRLVVSLRTGDFSFETFSSMVPGILDDLASAHALSVLPDHPNHAFMSGIMLGIYSKVWGIQEPLS